MYCLLCYIDILTFTPLGTQPSTFKCTSQVLNLHHLNTTDAAVLFQEVNELIYIIASGRT